MALLSFSAAGLLVGDRFNSNNRFVREVTSGQDAWFMTGVTWAWTRNADNFISWRFRSAGYTVTWDSAPSIPAVPDTAIRLKF